MPDTAAESGQERNLAGSVTVSLMFQVSKETSTKMGWTVQGRGCAKNAL